MRICNRVALAVAGVVAAIGLTSCGWFLVADSAPEDQWEEVFEFTMQPGTMNPAEAEEAIHSQVGPGRIVAGSVTHRGSVRAPGGSVDFFTYRVVDPELGAEPVFCTSTVAEFSMSAACGEQPPPQPPQPIQLNGESWGGAWRSADLLVQGDVARVEATAVDGTVYTVTPVNGFGYIEWPDERGSLELVAYDATGAELGRTFAGFDR